jgi:hypothetical protein
MSMVRKLHPHIAKDLRESLSENNISKKLVMDHEAETIEDFDDYSVDDILSARRSVDILFSLLTRSLTKCLMNYATLNKIGFSQSSI